MMKYNATACIRRLYIYLYVPFLVSLSGCTDPEWLFVTPMPYHRYGHDSTLGPDGKIYVMGGFVWYMDGGRYSNIAYDTGKSSWDILIPVLGGTFGPYQGAEKFSMYEQKTNTWIGLLSIPDRPGWYKVRFPKERKGEVLKISMDRLRKTGMSRQGDGVAIVTGKDGLIYWLGGKEQRQGFGENIVLPYDAINRKWPDVGRKRIECGGAHRYETIYKTNIPRMLERRIDHEAAVISDGRIYVLGGRRGEYKKPDIYDCFALNSTGKKVVTGTMECYDPRTNKWTYKKPMPVERFAFAAVVGPDDRIYTFGGGGQFTDEGSEGSKWITYDRTDVYDPRTDTWSSRAPMPAPRDTHAGVLGVDGKIYILGGSDNNDTPVKDVFIYDPIKDKWKKGPSMKMHRSTLSAVATPDGKIYAIGGTDVGAFRKKSTINSLLPKKLEFYDGKVQNTVEILDISKKRWMFWD